MQTDLLLQIALCDPAVYRQLIKTNKSIYELAKSKYGINLRNERFQTIETDGNNKTVYKLFGKKHRDNDLPSQGDVPLGPAVIYADGSQFWYRNGHRHRDNDLPAEIWADGTQRWYQNGKLHRDNDLPSIIYTNGEQRWYQNGQLHRDNDLPSQGNVSPGPAIIRADGSQCWYQNGKIHRDNDLPAEIWADGSRFWYQNGQRHRDNVLPFRGDVPPGPAIIWANGSQEWYQNGHYIGTSYHPVLF